MSASRTKRTTEAETVPQLPQSTPQVGMPGHDFTLQAVMEMQKSIGEMNAKMDAMKTSLDGLKGKVDDLVGWKNKILGGVAVLGVVIAGLTWVISKASDYVEVKTKQMTSDPPTLGQTQVKPVK